jgi:hypothetical protein
MVLISQTKTTPWPHMVVKNVKEENASDKLKNCFVCKQTFQNL